MSDDGVNECLAGKVALITGGSKGIGKGVAIALARAGAQVVVTYLSDGGAAEALVSEIGADKALAVRSDSSSIEDIERLVKETVGRFGCIDILIANAAVSPEKVVLAQILAPSAPSFSSSVCLCFSGRRLPDNLGTQDLASTTETDFDQAFAMNVKGPFFLVQV